MISYQVTEAEYYLGYQIAARRRLGKKKTRDKDSGSSNSTTDKSEALAAMAELVVGRATDSYPVALVGRYSKTDPDLLNNLEVRATKYRTGRIILRKGDKDKSDRFYVLVVYEETDGLPIMHIMGAIKAADGMVPEFEHDPEDKAKDGSYCWRVEQGALISIKELCKNRYERWPQIEATHKGVSP